MGISISLVDRKKKGNKLVPTGLRVEKKCKDGGEAASFYHLVAGGHLDKDKAAKSKTIEVEEMHEVAKSLPFRRKYKK
jgi:hypothetical protein